METKPFEQVMERFRALRIDEPFDMIVAIADGGILPAGILCRKLGLPVYLLRLNLRDECQHKLYDRPKLLRPIDFDFAGKRILLVEDRIKTGTTIRYAKELLADGCGDDQDLRGERSGRLLPVRRGLFSFSVGAVKSVFLMFFCRKRNGSVFSSNVLKTKTGRNF